VSSRALVRATIGPRGATTEREGPDIFFHSSRLFFFRLDSIRLDRLTRRHRAVPLAAADRGRLDRRMRARARDVICARYHREEK